MQFQAQIQGIHLTAGPELSSSEPVGGGEGADPDQRHMHLFCPVNIIGQSANRTLIQVHDRQHNEGSTLDMIGQPIITHLSRRVRQATHNEGRPTSDKVGLEQKMSIQ